MTIPQFFTREWWTVFVSAWNVSDCHTDLAGLGHVRFCTCLRGNRIHEDIFWDEHGIAMLTFRLNPDKEFFATEGDWKKFLRGDIQATEALLEGLLSYNGRIHDVLPYSLKFNAITTVTRDMVIVG